MNRRQSKLHLKPGVQAFLIRVPSDPRIVDWDKPSEALMDFLEDLKFLCVELAKFHSKGRRILAAFIRTGGATVYSTLDGVGHPFLNDQQETPEYEYDPENEDDAEPEKWVRMSSDQPDGNWVVLRMSADPFEIGPDITLYAHDFENGAKKALDAFALIISKIILQADTVPAQNQRLQAALAALRGETQPTK